MIAGEKPKTNRYQATEVKVTIWFHIFYFYFISLSFPVFIICFHEFIFNFFHFNSFCALQRVCYEPVACVSEMRDPKDLNSSFNPPNIPPPALSIMGGSNSVYGFVPPNIPLLNAHTGSVGPVHNNLATNIGFSLQPVPDGNAGVGGAGSLASGTDFNTNYATLYNTPFHSPFPGEI